ncbi:MAG: helix-turn-helix domain-containing protein [Paludibacteraceae bacterium]|nr:helix-turn-helix domain-containing protein [Paludibacteraceae bacterium]
MKENLIVAKNIKLMREAANFTQEKVADFLGIKRSAYANYETGDRELPLSLMEKLADLYGCDAILMYAEDSNVVENMLTTAFRVDNLTAADMVQVAAFKKVVKNSLMLDSMLEQ